MRTHLALVPFLCAGLAPGCTKAIVLLGDTGLDTGSSDSAADADTDGDTDTDTDADSDADTDTDTDTDTATDSGGDTATTPVADFSSFTGTQHFTYSSWVGDCDDSVDVVGTAVASGSDTWNAALAACPDCTSFYDVTYSASSVCGWISLPSYVHGLRIIDTLAETTVLEANYSGGYDVYGQDLSGTFDGFTFDYDVTVNLYGLDVRVDGFGTFPPQ